MEDIRDLYDRDVDDDDAAVHFRSDTDRNVSTPQMVDKPLEEDQDASPGDVARDLRYEFELEKCFASYLSAKLGTEIKPEKLVDIPAFRTLVI